LYPTNTVSTIIGAVVDKLTDVLHGEGGGPFPYGSKAAGP
jgi:hypothetical protein